MEQEIISFEEASKIFALVEMSSFYEILLIAAVMIPLYVGGWIYILNQFKVSTKLRPLILGSLIFVYAAGIFLYKLGYEERITQSRVVVEKKFEHSADKIIDWLNYVGPDKPEIWNAVGFKRVRESIDSRYEDEFLEALIDRYPKTFRRCYMDSLDTKALCLRK